MIRQTLRAAAQFIINAMMGGTQPCPCLHRSRLSEYTIVKTCRSDTVPREPARKSRSACGSWTLQRSEPESLARDIRRSDELPSILYFNRS